MESPFDVLQIEPGTDEEGIERAYKRRVKETHPDHGGSAEAFQRVRSAYEELTAREGSVGDGERRDRSEDREQPDAHVEYLNYEVLDDHGWDIDDGSLFETAADAGLDPADYGRFAVDPGDSLLEAAESCGYTWPFACRGGACANCAVALTAGELSQPVNHILPPDVVDRGIRLSCMGAPITDEVRVVYNVKHLPYLEELRLPPRPFRQAYGSD